MHDDIDETCCYVECANGESRLRVRHEVCEHHQAVSEHDDGALVEDLHLRVVGGLQGLYVHQVNDKRC